MGLPFLVFDRGRNRSGTAGAFAAVRADGRSAQALVGLVCALVALGHAEAAFGQASFAGLGDLPDGIRNNRAYAISADGTIVAGLCYYGINANAHAFRWTAATGMVQVPAGFDLNAAAYAVSGDGLVIAGFSNNIVDLEAFRWTAAGGPELLFHNGTITGASFTGDTLVGYVIDGGTHQHHAVRWTAQQHQRSIEPQGMAASEAQAVSGDGSVIVGEAFFTGLLGARAFIWTAATGMQNIGSANSNGPSSAAYAITPDGTTVVGGTATAGSSHFQVFRWTAVGGMQLLSTLPGTTDSIAYGVSSDGKTIIGTATGGTGSKAFIWRPGPGMQELQLVLGTAVPPGWTLTDARAVSADGHTVTGSGVAPTPAIESWIATISSRGDLNCDGVVNFADIDPFVLALSDPAGYAQAFPNCDILNGDCNGDGVVNFADIDPFVALLSH